MSSDIIKITDGKRVIEVTERVFEVIYADRGWGKLGDETEAETEAKKAPAKTAKGK